MTEEEVNWTEVHNEDFPAKDDKPEGEIMRDQVTTLTIPEDVRAQGSYCVKVEARGASGSWKKGWLFEGIAITMASEDDSKPKKVKEL
mmetsp:Transcript_18577/g.25002  ORF Transcript_18577/g.25002 Transcript_18577/m.25002 type:complete len:88 (-) Transcript_18577:95-358(-)